MSADLFRHGPDGNATEGDGSGFRRFRHTPIGVTDDGNETGDGNPLTEGTTVSVPTEIQSALVRRVEQHFAKVLRVAAGLGPHRADEAAVSETKKILSLNWSASASACCAPATDVSRSQGWSSRQSTSTS